VMVGHSYRKDNKQSSKPTAIRNKPQSSPKPSIANMGNRAFHTSENIMQLQRTVGNKAVLQMMKSRSLEQQATIQRQITYKNENNEVIAFPNTWKQLQRAKESMPEHIKKLTESLLDQIRSSIDGEINEKTLMTAWGKVAKDKKRDFDLETQSSDIVEAFKKRYNHSTKSKENYQNRSNDFKKIGEELVKEDSSLKFKGGARKPMVTSKKLEEFSYDKETSKESQIQTQISTIMYHVLGGEGEEIQSSLSKDKSNLMISSNLNSINEIMGEKLQDQQSLKSTAQEILIGHGIKDMDRETVMNNRLLRHAMKMFDRISKYLSDTATVSIPPKITVINLDGRHAEIRIEQSDGWNEEDYFLPSGTKYPCMGCKLYFEENEYDTGVTMGPLWLTNSSLSTQMEPQLKEGMKLGILGDKIDEVSSKIVSQYNAYSKNVKMGWGKKKNGKFTLDHQADSESELDDEEFERVKTNVLKRKREDDDETEQRVRKKRKIDEKEGTSN
jgi:hypothetical protein